MRYSKKVGKDYLDNYLKILEEHEHIFDQIWKDTNRIDITEQSLKSGYDMYQNLLQVIKQQHTVCIECVGEKPSKIQTVLRYFR